MHRVVRPVTVKNGGSIQSNFTLLGLPILTDLLFLMVTVSQYCNGGAHAA